MSRENQIIFLKYYQSWEEASGKTFLFQWKKKEEEEFDCEFLLRVRLNMNL